MLKRYYLRGMEDGAYS